MSDETRRHFLASPFAAAALRRLPRIAITVRILFDRGAHGGKGLTPGEISLFQTHQNRARRDYDVSGIAFDEQIVEGAFLRQQGYSEIPDRFLARRAINVFVTETLGYDIDRHRTGGSSMGPRPPGSRLGADPHYKIFLGLKDAGQTTLEHEYAHHFLLDTTRNPTEAANFWADLRIDYLLWRQRRGVAIASFRACANSEWARLESEAQPAATLLTGS